jgi:hypothetical protein
MRDRAISAPRDVALRMTLRLTLVLVTTTGCADRPSPVDVPPPPAAASPDAGPANATAALTCIDDALVRIIPALDEPRAVVPLRATLTELRTALAAGDGRRVSSARAAAQRALEGYARAAGRDGPELDAVRLALDAVPATR